MTIFYKKWKNYNEIQLKKNKMDLNIRKMTNHPPSPVIWHQTQQICMYCNTLHNNGCQGNCCQLWLTSKQKQITYVSLFQFSLKAQVYQSTTISYVPLQIHIVYSQLQSEKSMQHSVWLQEIENSGISVFPNSHALGKQE